MPHDPAYEARVVQLLTALKGAPLSCLFAMLLLDRRVGAKELQTITGYSKVTILGGLEKLEKLGFAARYARYESWQLTDKGVQLPLWPKQHLVDGGEVQKLNLEVEKISSGSSSSLTLNTTKLEQQPQLPDPSEVQNLNLEVQNLNLPSGEETLEPEHPALADLVELAVGRCACPRTAAYTVITEALAAGDSPAFVEWNTLQWLAYCQNDKLSKGVNNPGAFILSKIKVADCVPEQWRVSNQFHPFYTRLCELDRAMACEWGDGASDQDVPAVDGEDEDCGEELAPQVEEEPMVGSMTLKQVWGTALSQLQLQMPRETYNAWVRRATVLSYEDNHIVLDAHNGPAKDWLESRLHPLIQRTLASIIGHDVQVRFEVRNGEGVDAQA